MVSRADMSDWVVREFRRTAVLHAGVRYCLDHREHRDGAFHYALKRWPDELRDMAGGIIEYDREYVARRDAYTRALTKARRAEPLLVPLYPLIGLLPGRVKGWTADRYGLSEETLGRHISHRRSGPRRRSWRSEWGLWDSHRDSD